MKKIRMNFYTFTLFNFYTFVLRFAVLQQGLCNENFYAVLCSFILFYAMEITSWLSIQ